MPKFFLDSPGGAGLFANDEDDCLSDELDFDTPVARAVTPPMSREDWVMMSRTKEAAKKKKKKTTAKGKGKAKVEEQSAVEADDKAEVKDLDTPMTDAAVSVSRPSVEEEDLFGDVDDADLIAVESTVGRSVVSTVAAASVVTAAPQNNGTANRKRPASSVPPLHGNTNAAKLQKLDEAGQQTLRWGNSTVTRTKQPSAQQSRN